MQNFDTIEQELNKMEMLQEKLDRKVKDAAVYKDVNEKLVSIIKIAFICVVLIVAIFSTALVITYSKAQQNLCDFLSNGSLCSEQTAEEMVAGDNDIILNDISDSTLSQSNAYNKAE